MSDFSASASASAKNAELLVRLRNIMLDRSTPVGKIAVNSTNTADLIKFFRETGSKFDESIGIDDFCECLTRNFGFTDKESSSLFIEFDDNNDGSIDFNEFIHHLYTSLSTRRFRIAKHIFDYVDENNSGVITHADFVEHIKKEEEVVGVGADSKNKVRCASDDAVGQFLEKALGNIQHDHDSRVTFSEFVARCESLSARITIDDVFAQVLCNVWKIASPSKFMYNDSKRVEDMSKAELQKALVEARERIVKLNQRFFTQLSLFTQLKN